MLKTFATLLRGVTARSAEEVLDRHALVILDQQIRDAAQALDTSRRALAVALAQDRAEAKRSGQLRERIRDLEARAIEAIKGGRDDLAKEAAETIATLEEDAAVAEEACSRFAGEAGRLRSTVANAERRLTQLERGRRTAQAAETVRRLRGSAGQIGTVAPGSPLAEAEATLSRLERQQAEAEAACEALEELEASASPASLTERLAEQGFGARLRSSADDVLERLKRQAETGEAPGAAQ